MTLLHGQYRGSVCKGGPRALTFAPASLPRTLSNCPTCDVTYSVTEVLGEDGEGGQPLVHGKYEIDADVNMYWQQVSPEEVCDVNPFLTGIFLRGGSSMQFFVEAANRDGIIVAQFCQDGPTTCQGSTNAFARINRRDTIRTMAETGEEAELPPSDVSNACGGVSGSSANDC